jgi:peptide/nickel transport system substrate-binding protein
LKKQLVFVLLLVLSLSVLVSAQETPLQGGTFRYGTTVNPRGMFNPILYTEEYDAYVIEVVYDGLIEIDAALQPQPKVAKMWEVSDDGLEITFHLQEGIKFHDGVELTAKDVAYTYMTILHPDYTGVRFGTFNMLVGAQEYKDGTADNVPGIEILDDYTIKFSTVRPHAPLLSSFGYGILPSHLLAHIPVGELETAPFNLNPVGSGPFKFVEFLTDQHVTLAANEEYFFGRPNIDTLVYQKVSQDTIPIFLQQNRIDFIEISPDQFLQVSDLAHIDTYIYEALSYSYLAFNLRQERFSDAAVRQAITYGFDRQLYVDIIREGFGIVANAPMPTASWAYTDEGVDPYHYDPERAANMLAEAGWTPGSDGILQKDGEKLAFEFLVPDGSRLTEQMALLFQQNMEDIGIQIDLMFMEFSAAVDRVDAREFDTFTMSWSLSVDPDPYGIWHSTSLWNDPGYNNPESDRLIEQGRLETDLEKRKEIYSDWQRVINHDLPSMFLNYGVSIGALNDRVKGFDPDPGPYGPLVDRQLLSKIWLTD